MRKRPRSALARAFRGALAVLGVVALVLAGASALVLRLARAPFKGYAGESVVVTISPGAATASVVAELEREGVVRDRRLAHLVLRLFHRGETLKAGEYRFQGPITLEEALRPVLQGDVVTYRVAVPEGLTAPETFALFTARGLGSEGELLALAQKPGLFPGVPAEAPSLEGFLFPDTYTVTRATTSREIAGLLVRQLFRTLPATYEASARARGLSLLGAVTLASLVEEETRLAAERPVVAAVYLNRLRTGMLLQCDPTVVYASRRAGLYTGAITRKDLLLDDPYNTYVRPGLPPGPIASPGLASLLSAVAPADVPYLYFVASGEGGHRFARDYADHLRNVALWRRHEALARDGRATP